MTGRPTQCRNGCDEDGIVDGWCPGCATARFMQSLRPLPKGYAERIAPRPAKTCRFDGCGNHAVDDGLCSRHARQLVRRGP